MRSFRRLLVCVALAMVAGVGLAAPPASAAPAQIQRDVWLPSNADYGSGTHCAPARTITLAAGDYLWEHFEVLLDRTTGGDYSSTFRRQRDMYLRAGNYRWTTCLVYVPNSCTGPGGSCESNAYVRHVTSLTEVSTGGVSYIDAGVYDANYEYITRFGSNLWQCSTNTQC